MKLVGYVRVSRVAGREGETFISPSVQREQIAALAVARGHEVVEWIEDLDQPGTKYERPGFQRALEMVESGAADGLAAAKLDRFARSVIDGKKALARLRDAGGVLVLVAESLDTSTPMGKAMFTILLAFAELEVDRIRDSWEVARSRAIERGVYVAVPPFGYLRATDEVKDKDGTVVKHRGRLEPNPETRGLALDVFRRAAGGESWKAIADWLDEVAPDRAPWSMTTIRRMTTLRTYLGESEGRPHHEAIVPRDLFERAQREPGSVPRRGESDRLLTGLVFCSSCGGRMSGCLDGYGGAAYRCRNRLCDRKARVSTKLADEYIERRFLSWLGRFDSFEVAASEPSRSGSTPSDLTTDLELAEDELTVYNDASLVRIIGIGAFKAGLEQRRARVVALKKALRDAVPDEGPEFSGLAERWEDLSPAEKREWIRYPIERIVVSPGHVVGDDRNGRSTIPLKDRVRIVWRGADTTWEEWVEHSEERLG